MDMNTNFSTDNNNQNMNYGSNQNMNYSSNQNTITNVGICVVYVEL